MKALLLVDLQLDFLDGGALEVENSLGVVAVANALQQKFDCIVATKDWHPANHMSFAANHPWRKPFQTMKIDGVDQILWPMHCIQGTLGSEFPRNLQQDRLSKIIYKGTDPTIDSYSAFFDNRHLRQTELHNYLTLMGITTLYIMGLALDFCVKFTASDAIALGYEVYVVTDGCQAISKDPAEIALIYQELELLGCHLVECAQIQ